MACVCVGEKSCGLTQFTLSALEAHRAVADEGITSVHTRTPVLAGQTAAVLGQLWKTTAAINVRSTEWEGVLMFQAHYWTLSSADTMCKYPPTLRPLYLPFTICFPESYSSPSLIVISSQTFQWQHLANTHSHQRKHVDQLVSGLFPTGHKSNKCVTHQLGSITCVDVTSVGANSKTPTRLRF